MQISPPTNQDVAALAHSSYQLSVASHALGTAASGHNLFLSAPSRIKDPNAQRQWLLHEGLNSLDRAATGLGSTSKGPLADAVAAVYAIAVAGDARALRHAVARIDEIRSEVDTVPGVAAERNAIAQAISDNS